MALIDVYATGGSLNGGSAFHAVFSPGYVADQAARVISLLLLHGANPLLRDDQGDTPLERLRHGRPNDRTTIALLERAMAEPQRTFLLSKAHHQVDALLSLNKVAKKTAGNVEEKCNACVAKAPVYLKERVAAGGALPVVVLARVKGCKERPWDEADEKEKLGAVLAFVLGEPQQQLGGGGEKKGQEQSPGMLAEVFVELLEMMAPKWDPIRGGAAAGGGSI